MNYRWTLNVSENINPTYASSSIPYLSSSPSSRRSPSNNSYQENDASGDEDLNDKAADSKLVCSLIYLWKLIIENVLTYSINP